MSTDNKRLREGNCNQGLVSKFSGMFDGENISLPICIFFLSDNCTTSLAQNVLVDRYWAKSLYNINYMPNEENTEVQFLSLTDMMKHIGQYTFPP